MVGGPQIGYNYPGLTMEMGLYGPTIRARGATSAPFPGYMLIGRGGAVRLDADLRRRATSSTPTPSGSAAARARSTATRASAAGWRRVKAGTISKGGDSVKVRFRRTVHGPVVGYARVAGSQARGRALAPPVQRRPRDDRPDLLPAADVRPREERERLHRRRGGDAADVQLVLRRRQGHRVRHHRAAARAREGRQRRPAGRRPRPLRVAGFLAAAQAPAGRRPAERAARQLEQQAGEGLPGRRRPLGRGRHAARRLAPGGAGAHATSTRRRPCSARRTRAPRPTRAG